MSVGLRRYTESTTSVLFLESQTTVNRSVPFTSISETDMFKILKKTNPVTIPILCSTYEGGVLPGTGHWETGQVRTYVNEGNDWSHLPTPLVDD